MLQKNFLDYTGTKAGNPKHGVSEDTFKHNVHCTGISIFQRTIVTVCRRSMDHRTEAGEVVYKILSDVDSDCGEQPVEDESQNLTHHADPLDAEHGESECEGHSGWVMRQSPDSRMRYNPPTLHSLILPLNKLAHLSNNKKDHICCPNQKSPPWQNL